MRLRRSQPSGTEARGSYSDSQRSARQRESTDRRPAIGMGPGVRRALSLLAGATAVLLVATASAEPISTQAREAFVIDATTGTVLFSQNADRRMPTASMSKMMTMYMVFEAIEAGRLSFDDTLPVSERAWRMGGSRMFVEVGSEVRVEDLVRGVIVQSGNDACVVFAEALAGSEEEFSRQMTERAHSLGMVNSNFANSTGWPSPDHYSTAQDLAILAHSLMRDFPQYYHFYSETEFTYNDITQQNRNPLLYRDIGADGLKTGHTEEAGYGLTASAVQGERRVTLVVNGLGSTSARAEEALRLIDWAFREFESIELFDAEEVIDEAQVWMGTEWAVPLIATTPVNVTMPRNVIADIEVRVRVLEPVPAPITRGQQIATLVVTVPDMPDHEIPLFAGADVPRDGVFGRIVNGAAYYVSGLVQ